MAAIMEKSAYEIERVAVMTEEYGDEVLCAGWNPQLALATEQPVVTGQRHVKFPADLANADVDAFLQRMYQCQR
jgi:hypothetical protein